MDGKISSVYCNVLGVALPEFVAQWSAMAYVVGSVSRIVAAVQAMFQSQVWRLAARCILKRRKVQVRDRGDLTADLLRTACDVRLCM
jgi:hypothetical protein